jgi:hypothetical protein
MCEKKVFVVVDGSFLLPDLPDCTIPWPRRWLCAYDIIYLHKLYVCNQCFRLRGVYMGSAAGGNNEKARRYRLWCWSCIHKTQNTAFYWVMGSAHSMKELNTNRRDCLCMYVRMDGWIDWWMCVGVLSFKNIYMFQQENLVYLDVIHF